MSKNTFENRKPSVIRSNRNIFGELYQNVKGELWKMRRTLLPVLHVLLPVLGILVFLFYYSFAAWSDEGKISGYIQVLSIVFPLVVSIICAMSVEMEEKGHFQTFLGVAVYRGNPLFAKWLVLAAMGFAAILLAVLGFTKGFQLRAGKVLLSTGEALTLAWALWLCGMNLYLFHLFLNLAFSKNISLWVGTAELLVAALFLTELGEGRWQFFPCAWGGRWCGYLLQCWIGSGTAATEYMIRNLVISAIITLLLWCGVFLWIPFYEGRQCKD